MTDLTDRKGSSPGDILDRLTAESRAVIEDAVRARIEAASAADFAGVPAIANALRASFAPPERCASYEAALVASLTALKDEPPCDPGTPPLDRETLDRETFAALVAAERWSNVAAELRARDRLPPQWWGPFAAVGEQLAPPHLWAAEVALDRERGTREAEAPLDDDAALAAQAARDDAFIARLAATAHWLIREAFEVASRDAEPATLAAAWRDAYAGAREAAPDVLAAVGEDVPEHGRMFRWDARFAAWLEARPDAATAGLTKLAAVIRRKAAKRWATVASGAEPFIALWYDWLPMRGMEPPEHLVRLARYAWRVELRDTYQAERAERERRERMAPAIFAWQARALAAAPAANHIERSGGATVFRADDWQTAIPAAALAEVAQGALDERERRAVAIVAAHLAIEVHRRWQAGEPDHRLVPMPRARERLRTLLGAELTEADLVAALEWLQGFKVADWRCVDGWSPEAVDTGGRPALSLVVNVGLPLGPQALERVYRQAGMTLPAELRWLSPVLPPSHVPRAGNRRTLERQRAAFTLGIGAALIDLREEYAERGGVELTSLRRPLRAMGIYDRSHHSLLDDVLDAWRMRPEPPLLPGLPTGPVLVELSPGSGLWRLGPDYQAAHRMIVKAAGRTEVGRKRRRGGKR